MSLLEKECMILGLGYVGRFYLEKYPNLKWTSRKLKTNSEKSLYFDLLNKQSWNAVESARSYLWTFPAAQSEEELKNAVDFFNLYLKNKNTIILSSTSVYKTTKEHEEVDENSLLNLTEHRFKAEEELRKQGAMILHLSGIIGPDRYPKYWYEKNRVKYGGNILNYIHVDDIVFFVTKLFAQFKPCERFNLTSGDFKTHQQIAKLLNINSSFEFSEQSFGSKKVNHNKILQFLNETSYQFKLYPEDCAG